MYYHIVSIIHLSHSPVKKGFRFSLNASRASSRSRVGRSDS